MPPAAPAGAGVVVGTAPGTAWAPPEKNPFIGVQWNVGLIGLLIYLYVVHRGASPFGEIGVVAAGLGVIIAAKSLRLPAVIILFAIFLGISGMTAVKAAFATEALAYWVDYAKIGIIFFVACNLIRTTKQLRIFILIWLALFAFFPMRGAFINYAGGYTMMGRMLWNFSFSNPNDLAALCIMPFAMCAGLLVTERRGPLWYAAALQLILLLMMIFLTQSRGGIIAVTCMIVAIVLSVRPSVQTLLMYAGIAALLAFVAPDNVWDRLGGLSKVAEAEEMEGVDLEGSAQQRFAIWRVATEMISDNPVFGVGIGTYPLNHREYVRTRALPLIARGARDTHSTYLSALAETGAVGLALLLSIWGILLIKSGASVRKIRAWSPKLALQLQFLRFGFMGFMVAGIWGSYERVSFMWLYVALIYVFGEIYVPMAAAASGLAPALAPTGRRGSR